MLDPKQLKAFIDRIERLESEKANIADDIKAVFDEAKAMNFDVKALRQIIKDRKTPDNEREEREYILAQYKAALGMLNDTPLGNAALKSVA